VSNPDFNFKFPGDKKIMDSLKEWSEKFRKQSLYLQEKAGLAMVNRKHPNEFDDEEIAGCAAKVMTPWSAMWTSKEEPRVSITMDENGYTIAEPQPPGSISASLVWVTFAQLDEVEALLPAYGYRKVDGKWQRG